MEDQRDAETPESNAQRDEGRTNKDQQKDPNFMAP